MRVTLTGVVLILIIILVTKGFGAFAGVMTTILDGVWQFIKTLASIAVRFPSELGITDWISARVFFLILTVLLGTVGIFLTAKQERKLLGIITDTIAVVSLLLTLTA